MTEPVDAHQCPVCDEMAIAPIVWGTPPPDADLTRTDVVYGGPVQTEADHACRSCRAQYADTMLLPPSLESVENDPRRVAIEFAMLMLDWRISYAPPPDDSVLGRALVQERLFKAGEITQSEFEERVKAIRDDP